MFQWVCTCCSRAGSYITDRCLVSFPVGLYLLFPGGFALCGLLFAVAALCVPHRPSSVSPTDALRHYQQNSTDTLYGEDPPAVVPSVSHGDRPVAGLQSEA